MAPDPPENPQGKGGGGQGSRRHRPDSGDDCRAEHGRGVIRDVATHRGSNASRQVGDGAQIEAENRGERRVDRIHVERTEEE